MPLNLEITGIDIHSKCLVKPFFAIENPPSPSQNKKLFKDLHRQNEHKQAICSSNKGSSLRIKHEGKKSSALDRCQLLESCSLSIYLCKPRARSYPLICNSPKSSHANSRRKQSLHHHHIGLMLSTLDHLHVQAIHYNIELTTILMPPITPPKSAGLFRRSNTPPSTWGSYILLPRAASPQEPEQETPEDQDLPSEPRPGSESEPQTESESEPEAEPGAEPGSEPDSDTPPLARPIIGGIIDDLQSAGQEEQEEPPSPSAAQDEPRPSASPPVGILPVCYTSQSDCDATTHACSGHGACVQKYSYPEGGSSNINNTCFACRCDVDTNENRQGQRVTTQWAGPACQKQDVSSAFWLLGGFSVVLVSVIAWAVGLLISMGNEELPSVIGAGVAGPRAR